MDIKWVKEAGDYASGVKLYASLPQANKNIVRRLNEGENGRNKATLKYELGKIMRKGGELSVSTKKMPTPIKKEADHYSINPSLVHSNGNVTMAMLPNQGLRARFVEKNGSFYKRWELKRKLNETAEGKEDEALQLIIEIMNLTRFIDSVWFEIDYYLEHKKLLPTSTKDFSKLSAMGKLKERQRLWAKKSKREATLKKWELELAQIDEKHKKQLIEAKTNKQKEVLTQISIDIDCLNELINADG